jgi:hypothetical protein
VRALPGLAWHAAAVVVAAAAPGLTPALHTAEMLAAARLLHGLTPTHLQWLLAVLLQALLQSAHAPCTCCSLLLQLLLLSNATDVSHKRSDLLQVVCLQGRAAAKVERLS